MPLLLLPSDVLDLVLQHLPARELLRVRATCPYAKTYLDSPKLRELKVRLLSDRVVVIVRRYLAYRKVEKLLSDKTWWHDGSGPVVYRNKKLAQHATRPLEDKALSPRLGADPLSILERMRRTPTDANMDFCAACVLLHATEVC